jgi:hypothetical protein
MGPYPYYGRDTELKTIDDYNLEGTWLICGESVLAISNRNTINVHVVEGKSFIGKGYYAFRCDSETKTRFFGRALRNTSIKGLMEDMLMPSCRLNIEALKQMEFNLPDLHTMMLVEKAYSRIENSLNILKAQEQLLMNALDIVFRKTFRNDNDGNGNPVASAYLGELMLPMPGKDLSASLRGKGNVPLISSFGLSGYHDTALTTGETIILSMNGNTGRPQWSPISCWPLGRCVSVDSSGSEAPLPWLFFALRMALADLNASDSSSNLTPKRLLLEAVPIGNASLREWFSRIASAVLAKKTRSQARHELLTSIKEQSLDALVIRIISRRPT